MTVLRYDNTFCVQTQGFSVTFPDTPANRKVAVIFLRGMRDAHGKLLFTLAELASIVESSNRQAASGHVEEFRASGPACLSDLPAAGSRQGRFFCGVDAEAEGGWGSGGSRSEGVGAGSAS